MFFGKEQNMAETQKNASFSLGEHDRDFIDNQVAKGRFGNKTEVVRAGLRLLEDYENKQRALRVLIDEGLEDVANGRVARYKDAQTMLKDIIED